jgi:hypothetical protein
MKNLAIFENDKVINILAVADNYELQANEMFYTNENAAHIGGDFVDGYFYSAQPYPSWLRKKGNWIAPKPLTKERVLVHWDESVIDWVDNEALAE